MPRIALKCDWLANLKFKKTAHHFLIADEMGERLAGTKMLVPRSIRSLGPDDNIIRPCHYLLQILRYCANTSVYSDSTDTYYLLGKSIPGRRISLLTTNSSDEELQVHDVIKELKETDIIPTILSYRSVIRLYSYKKRISWQ